MTTEIIYNGWNYDIRIDGIWVGHERTHHAAEQIIASIKEAEHSWIMGGNALLIEAGRFAARGWDVFCGTCHGEGRIPANGCGDQAGGWAETCPDCDGRPRMLNEGELEQILTQIDAVHTRLENERRPLLAQCAALLDSLLGGPVVGGGIIDEMRRVRAALAKEGW